MSLGPALSHRVEQYHCGLKILQSIDKKSIVGQICLPILTIIRVCGAYGMSPVGPMDPMSPIGPMGPMDPKGP